MNQAPKQPYRTERHTLGLCGGVQRCNTQSHHLLLLNSDGLGEHFKDGMGRFLCRPVSARLAGCLVVAPHWGVLAVFVEALEQTLSRLGHAVHSVSLLLSLMSVPSCKRFFSVCLFAILFVTHCCLTKQVVNIFIQMHNTFQ